MRQHLSRLPTIDPNTRTLLLCGYPNVGKSSFINKVRCRVPALPASCQSLFHCGEKKKKFHPHCCPCQVTRADVDVQPYAFTTKSLFVGHMDYRYLRWQVGVANVPSDFHPLWLILCELMVLEAPPTLSLCVCVCAGGGHSRHPGPPPGGEEHHRDAGHHGSGPSEVGRPLRDGCVGAVRPHASAAAGALQQHPPTVCQQGLYAAGEAAGLHSSLHGLRFLFVLGFVFFHQKLFGSTLLASCCLVQSVYSGQGIRAEFRNTFTNGKISSKKE